MAPNEVVEYSAAFLTPHVAPSFRASRNCTAARSYRSPLYQYRRLSYHHALIPFVRGSKVGITVGICQVAQHPAKNGVQHFGIARKLAIKFSPSH